MATLLPNPRILTISHTNSHHSPSFPSSNFRIRRLSPSIFPHNSPPNPRFRKSASFTAFVGEDNPTGRTFLSFEEAGLVEMSGLSTHERFLCRLTISSLNLLRVVAEQEGCEIGDLNAGRVCDWFLKDKLKREQDVGSAVLQWDEESDEFML